jgi:hypothetical protein
MSSSSRKAPVTSSSEASQARPRDLTLWRLIAWAFALLALGLAGCSHWHECAPDESCNGRDDDCDGKVDESFRDARGRYVLQEHCGGCGVACDEVFPTAQATLCDASHDAPMCRIVTCPAGFHKLGTGACAQDQAVQCLPCESDDDCTARLPGSRCVESADGRRCAEPCRGHGGCTQPFQCDLGQNVCTPEANLCACNDVSDTFEVACVTQGKDPELQCAGLQTCGPFGLSQCEVASEESCNGLDDDCDGFRDEDFVDGAGRYVHRLHCGACGTPCVPPGEHYEATCVPDGDSARCDIACSPGFVDVDHVQGNGCECQIFDGTTAPVIVGSDADCDGVVDDDSTFVHVTNAGQDSAPGTLVKPMRTIAAAVQRASAEGKTVLVAQGSYAPFTIQGGVNVFGGYRTDFRDRNSVLYPVVVEQSAGADGTPALFCDGEQNEAHVEGITVVGDDADSAGRGATAVYLKNCGPSVHLSEVVVLAGRGADGLPGDDASARLPGGVSSLADLNGLDGRSGSADPLTSSFCSTLNGGSGGVKSCAGRNVSGGGGGAAECAFLNCQNGSPCANAGCTDFTINGVCDYDTVLAEAVANPPGADGAGRLPGAGGEGTYNAPTNRGTCSFCDDNPTLPRLGADGTDGAAGSPGTAGAGCAMGSLVVDTSGRASAASGSVGAGGTDGSGGGGGSAGNGYSVIGGTVDECRDVPGGSGGGGGSGGCGAPGGGAGGGGGASIGIVIDVDGTGQGPTLSGVRVVTASGGRGGDGGLGAAGGARGEGATGGVSQFWCARSGGRGGNGGAGGAGGGGGGGCGGATHAVYFAGSPASAYRNAVRSAVDVDAAGVPGQGGQGGFSPGKRGESGRAGSSAELGP